MANLSIQEVMAIIGNKELTLISKDKDIGALQAKIKELEDKIKGLMEVKTSEKEKSDG